MFCRIHEAHSDYVAFEDYCDYPVSRIWIFIIIISNHQHHVLSLNLFFGSPPLLPPNGNMENMIFNFEVVISYK